MMRPFRDSEHQSFLDRLDSNNRQLWIRLGRQLQPETMQNIKKQIQKNYMLINQIRPYERYNKLKNEQIQLREVLERNDNLLDEQKQISKKLNKDSKQFHQLKQHMLNMIRKIKEAQQLEHKINKISCEVKNMEGISAKLNDKQIMNYIGCLDTVKQNILNEKRKIQDQIIKLERKSKLMENYIENQKELWQKLSKQKNQLLKSLAQLKQQRMTAQINQKISQNIQQEFGYSSKLIKKQQQCIQNSYLIKKSETYHQKMQIKQKIPPFYKIWALLLIIWGILLIYFSIFRQKQIETKSPGIVDICY